MYLSTGNHKLKATQNIKFLIWNIPAQSTCPYSTCLCRKYCYAQKAERLYPQVLACREQNLQDSKQDNFVETMIQEICKYINRRTWRNKQVLFRIHESGDFYNREYTKKWVAIAKAFPSVRFLAFTKSLEFFSGIELPENFTVRFSVWADTNHDDLSNAIVNYPMYSCIEKGTYEALLEKQGEVEKCDCDLGCGECGKCWDKDLKLIFAKLH